MRGIDAKISIQFSFFLTFTIAYYVKEHLIKSARSGDEGFPAGKSSENYGILYGFPVLRTA